MVGVKHQITIKTGQYLKFTSSPDYTVSYLGVDWNDIGGEIVIDEDDLRENGLID